MFAIRNPHQSPELAFILTPTKNIRYCLICMAELKIPYPATNNAMWGGEGEGMGGGVMGILREQRAEYRRERRSRLSAGAKEQSSRMSRLRRPGWGSRGAELIGWSGEAEKQSAETSFLRSCLRTLLHGAPYFFAPAE